MKRLILIIVVIMFLAGCAAKTNLFSKNAAYSEPVYKTARLYCNNHSDKAGYDACMDREYLCSIEVGVITGAGNQTKAEAREANRKACAILKKNNLFNKFYSGNCSYCEILEIYKKEW